MLFTIPPSKIKDFCHLPLHKGGFRLRINKQSDKLEFEIDKPILLCYDTGNLQTDDAGIKAVTPPQRACGAGNQAGNELSNGPRRAQRTGNSVACDADGLR